MKSFLALGLLLFLGLGWVDAETDRVILGVLSQDSHKPHKQYIASSYVKFLESAGARVVPIFVGQPKSYYANLVQQLNGLLLPGGGAPLLDGPYAEAASHLLQLTIQLNKNGTHFPLWASCLSFEKVISDFVGNNSWQNFCYVEDISLNLEIEEPIKENPSMVRMFQDKSVPNIVQIMEKHPVAPNYHRICLTVDDFYHKYHLDEHFTLVSRNTYNNTTFVSTFEHKNYPIYGTQWHPEKSQFEFVVNEHVGNINHDRYSVLVGQYLANFLVNEARQNDHHFANKEEELNSLIYMYNKYRVFTGAHKGTSFEEIFEFPLPFKNGIHGHNWSVYLLILCFLSPLLSP